MLHALLQNFYFQEICPHIPLEPLSAVSEAVQWGIRKGVFFTLYLVLGCGGKWQLSLDTMPIYHNSLMLGYSVKFQLPTVCVHNLCHLGFVSVNFH